jgi:transcription elongation factor Elf1
MKIEEREHLLKTTGMINCSTCGDTKDKSEFGKDKSKVIGYNTQCKLCKKAYKLAIKQIEKDEPVQANVSWFDKFKMWLSA